jgi:hypothetical protein
MNYLLVGHLHIGDMETQIFLFLNSSHNQTRDSGVKVTYRHNLTLLWPVIFI